MAFCLDPDATITYGRLVAVSEAMGLSKVKAVQAVSELLQSGELEREVDSVFMEVRIVLGKKDADVGEEVLP